MSDTKKETPGQAKPPAPALEALDRLDRWFKFFIPGLVNSAEAEACKEELAKLRAILAAGEPQAPTQPPLDPSDACRDCAGRGCESCGQTGLDYAPDKWPAAPAPAAPGLDAATIVGLKLVCRSFMYVGPGPLRDAVTWIEKYLAAPVSPGEPPAAPCPGIVTKDLANWTCTYNREGVCLTCGQPRPAAGDRPLVPADHVTGPDKMVPALDLEAIRKDLENHLDADFVRDYIMPHLAPASPPSGTGRECWGLEHQGKIETLHRTKDSAVDAQAFYSGRGIAERKLVRYREVVEASNPKKGSDA